MTLYGTMVWVNIGIHCYTKLYIFFNYSTPYHLICTLGYLMVLVPMIYSTICSRTILYIYIYYIIYIIYITYYIYNLVQCLFINYLSILYGIQIPAKS